MSNIILNHLFWYIFGAALIVLELIIPGGIVSFIGAAALIVGLSLQLEWITDPVTAIAAWFFISLIFIVVLRSLLTKFIGGDTETGEIDEDYQAIGQIAEVVEEIAEGDVGRIRFRETTWKAKSSGKFIAKGSKVKIVARENIDWIVELIE